MHRYTVSVSLFIIMLCSMGMVHADEKTDLLEIIKIYDESILGNYQLRATIAKPVLAYTGNVRSSYDLQMSGMNGEYALSLSPLSKTTPTKIFSDIPSKSSNGVIHIGLEKQQIIHFNGYNWMYRSDMVNHEYDVIGNQSRTSQDGKSVYIEYDQDNHDAKNLYYRYLNALGRGYSQLLKSVDAVEYGDDNLYHVTATGNCYSPHMGTWILKIDPWNGFIIRSAEFTREESDQPILTMENVDKVGADLPIAKSGWLSIADFRIDIKTSAYENKPDGVFMADSRNKSRDTVEDNIDSTVINYNNARSDGIPSIRIIKQHEQEIR